MLKMAMLNLLTRKKIEEITVKELCDLAGVQRGTFYWHYNNTVELFDEVSQSDMNAIMQFHAERQKVELNVDAVKEFISFIKDKNTFLFVEYKNLEEFEQTKEVYKAECLKIFANSLGVDLADEHNYNALCFVFAGIYEYLMQWIKSDFKATEDEVAQHMYTMIDAITRTLPQKDE